MNTNTNTNRNINKRTCTTRPPGGPTRNRATSHRLQDDDSETGIVATATTDANPAPVSFQLRPNAVFDEESTTDQLSALHVLELLTAKLNGASLPRQSRALETLLRKERSALAVQNTWHKLREEQGKALGMCLDDSKKYPAVVELFRKAFAALGKAREESQP